MTLVEIEPGRWIAPDLVTEVMGGRNHDGWAWIVTIAMIGGTTVVVSGGTAHGDPNLAQRLGESKAREMAALIDKHRSPDAVTLVAL